MPSGPRLGEWWEETDINKDALVQAPNLTHFAWGGGDALLCSASPAPLLLGGGHSCLFPLPVLPGPKGLASVWNHGTVGFSMRGASAVRHPWRLMNPEAVCLPFFSQSINSSYSLNVHTEPHRTGKLQLEGEPWPAPCKAWAADQPRTLCSWSLTRVSSENEGVLKC